MKFDKQTMQDLAFDDAPEGFKVIENVIQDTSRWSVQSMLIFSHEDKFYRSYYQRGATEYQDECPYEYDGAEIEVTEVEPYEVTVTKYRPVGVTA